MSTCQHPDCTAEIPDHKWGQIRAEGWFRQRDGTVWCPLHVPDWVPQWRARRHP